MFIKKIEIENAFGFENKIILDLKQNRKNLEDDLKAGFFIEKNNQIITPIISIAGKNASGKTSFLKAIFEVLFFFRDEWSKSTLLNNIYNTEFLVKKENSPFRFLFSGIDFFKLNKIFINQQMELFFNVENVFEKKLTSKAFIFFKDDKLNDKYQEKVINNFLELISNYFKKHFNLIKNKLNKNTKISISFYDEKYGDFEINYFDTITNNSFDSFHFEINFQKKDQKITKEMLLDIIDYSNSIVSLNSYSDQWSITNDNLIKDYLFFLIENFSKKDVIKIVNVCDTSIVDFLFVRDDMNTVNEHAFKYFINKKGQEISIQKLSSGTKKFIVLFASFSASLKGSKNSSLFLVDEIDNYFHNEIINFIKTFVRTSNKQKDVQLFYTSHNPLVLTSSISSKQIFHLETIDDNIEFSKLSTQVNKNNSVLKQLIEKKIGEHPSDDFIRETVIDLYFDNFWNE